MSVVLFPAGKEGEGWLGIAVELHYLLFDPPTGQQWMGQRKPVWKRGEIKNAGKQKQRKASNIITYVEAAALKHRESKGEVIKKGQTENSKEVDRDWNKERNYGTVGKEFRIL